MIGIITRSDLLKPRAREVEEEIGRERFIVVRSIAADDAEDRGKRGLSFRVKR
jgi:hypothetical protein